MSQRLFQPHSKLIEAEDGQHAVVGIDSSIQSLGLGLVVAGKARGAWTLKQSGNSELSFYARAMHMSTYVVEVIRHQLGSLGEDRPPFIHAAVEVPANWFDKRGQEAKDSEAVQTLYSLCGCLVSYLVHSMIFDRIWVVRPRSWKGQLSKEQTTQRAVTFAARSGWVLNPPSHDAAEGLLLAKCAFDEKLHRYTNEALSLADGAEVGGFELVYNGDIAGMVKNTSRSGGSPARKSGPF